MAGQPGVTTEVVLERDARAFQMSQLRPGEMHPSFIAWQSVRLHHGAEEMLLGTWSWNSRSDEVEIRLR